MTALIKIHGVEPTLIVYVDVDSIGYWGDRQRITLRQVKMDMINTR